MRIILTRKQLYSHKWTPLLMGFDFSNIAAPLPKAVAAVLSEIAKEVPDG